MTIDCPLTCYICGKTSDKVTVDLLGCLKDQESAEKRFEEKFGEDSMGYLYICCNCYKKNRTYANNVYNKYGVYR